MKKSDQNNNPSVTKYGIPLVPAGVKYNFLLLDSFAITPFISAVEVLRLANRLSGEALYDWECCSVDGKSVTSCNGIEQAVQCQYDFCRDSDLIVVCGPNDADDFDDRNVIRWLRLQAAKKRVLGALDTGSYLLAKAGLLDGYKCTIHWEVMEGFREQFPQLMITQDILAIDRDRITCAGGTAALDMMLQLVEISHGHDLAAEISDILIHQSIRRPQEPQRMDLRCRTGISQSRLLEAIEFMEANLEQPLTLDEIASLIGISRRQLERLFKTHLTTSPSRHYLSLRLQRAQKLLHSTSMAVIDVAVACGFASASHFSKSYRELYGRPPRYERLYPSNSGGMTACSANH